MTSTSTDGRSRCGGSTRGETGRWEPEVRNPVSTLDAIFRRLGRYASTLDATLGSAPWCAPTLVGSLRGFPWYASSLDATFGSFPQHASSLDGTLGGFPRYAPTLDATLGSSPRGAPTLDGTFGGSPDPASSLDATRRSLPRIAPTMDTGMRSELRMANRLVFSVMQFLSRKCCLPWLTVAEGCCAPLTVVFRTTDQPVIARFYNHRSTTANHRQPSFNGAQRPSNIANVPLAQRRHELG